MSSSKNETDFNRRRRDLAQFIYDTAAEATRLGESLREISDEVLTTENAPEEKFAEGLMTLQNFYRNINFAQAANLTARCAAAEQKMNDHPLDKT